jgi:hypothetical protein
MHAQDYLIRINDKTIRNNIRTWKIAGNGPKRSPGLRFIRVIISFD